MVLSIRIIATVVKGEVLNIRPYGHTVHVSGVR